MPVTVEGITRPSITRLARQAGVKSVSEDCFDLTRGILTTKIDEIISAALVFNTEHATKTLMPEDIYSAMKFLGYNATESSEMGTNSCSK